MQAQWFIAGEIALQSFLALLVGGAVVGLCLGIWMYCQPERALRVSQFFSQWVSSRRMARPLNHPIYRIERPIYRYHRMFGSALLAGAGYILYTLWFRYDKAAAQDSLFKEFDPQRVSWLLDSAVVLLYLTSIVAAVIAVSLIFRPSLLRGIETWANKRLPTRPLGKPMDVMRMQPDEAMHRRPQLTGAIMALGSLYVLANLGFLIFTLGWKGLLNILVG